MGKTCHASHENKYFVELNVIRVKSDRYHIFRNIFRLWAANDFASSKPDP